MRTADPRALARVLSNIERQVVALNLALGLNPDIGVRATYGYIGNITADGDERTWFVFLPHPGREGGLDDRLGGHATDDLDGMLRTLAFLRGAVALARWSRAEGRSL